MKTPKFAKLGSCILALWLLVGGGFRASAAAPFFFIQFSDPQMGMFTDNQNFIQETANLEFAVANINRLHPAFVVVTGDLVNKGGDAAQIAEYKRIIAKVDSSIPVYNVTGNHDVGNVPTPKSIAAYTNLFGPDHYVFRQEGFVGIVLNSSLISVPTNAPELFTAQEVWLKAELQKARSEGAKHLVIFQHHPWFLKTADEPDQYFNLPRERRSQYVGWFHEFGVNCVFCGHYHQNGLGRDGALEVVTTGALGKPMGGSHSGLQIAIVRDDGIEHRFFELGEIPNRIDPAQKLPPAAASAASR